MANEIATNYKMILHYKIKWYNIATQELALDDIAYGSIECNKDTICKNNKIVGGEEGKSIDC